MSIISRGTLLEFLDFKVDLVDLVAEFDLEVSHRLDFPLQWVKQRVEAIAEARRQLQHQSINQSTRRRI